MFKHWESNDYYYYYYQFLFFFKWIEYERLTVVYSKTLSSISIERTWYCHGWINIYFSSPFNHLNNMDFFVLIFRFAVFLLCIELSGITGDSDSSALIKHNSFKAAANTNEQIFFFAKSPCEILDSGHSIVTNCACFSYFKILLNPIRGFHELVLDRFNHKQDQFTVKYLLYSSN